MKPPIMFGSILLVAGIVGLLTARRSLENTLAPNSDPERSCE